MSEFNEPSKSGWATFHRGCGWFLFALGGIGGVLILLLLTRGGKPEAAIQLLILGIAGGIASFFAAFLIDVFTDMRHYLQSGNSTLAEMNSKLTGLATGQLKIEVAKPGLLPRLPLRNDSNGLAKRCSGRASKRRH